MVGKPGRRAYRVLLTALSMVVAGVLVKAAGVTSKYDAELRRLRSDWRTAQQAEGLDPGRGAKALYAKYPTPEITFCTPVVIAPGASAPISLTGTFPPKTTFLVDHDQVALKPGATTAARYAARATVAADALPGIARLFAYAPVSGAWNRCGVVVIGATPAFTLTANNGWTIALAPTARAWVIDGDSASIGYRAEYFTPGAPAPFETMTGTLTVSSSDTPGGALTFSMQRGGTGAAMQEYQELVATMGDPAAVVKMSAQQRAAFEKTMEEVGDRMTREMEAMTADPAALQEKQAHFGCGSITVRVADGHASGSVSCGQRVGLLTLTGARK